MINLEKLFEENQRTKHSAMVNSKLADKRVMVTGGAGSIGGELVIQLLQMGSAVIALDQAESALHELESNIDPVYEQKLTVILGDITNQSQVVELFSKYKPEVIFHAAAYKHVPLLEKNPKMAIRTNVLGTQLLADMAIEFGVEHFILISTDKAVFPSSIMGASKRLAEKYVLTANSGSTEFVVTRFGNVFDSNGSVARTFKEQIKKGGPLTLTHESMERFFMTISDACHLVLEALTIGRNGEILVFDMGDPIRIQEIAKEMIHRLAPPGQKISIKVTGLRPGEKLAEERLYPQETPEQTDHPKIFKARSAESIEHRQEWLNRIKAYLDDAIEISELLGDLLPEYSLSDEDTILR